MASQGSPDENQITNGDEAISEAGSLLDDERSSSLSEIEDESEEEEEEEEEDLQVEGPSASQGNEIDSEAETERLEPSPHTPGRHTNGRGAVPFEKSPSKLAQAISANDNENEADDQFSDSEMSSPLASLEEPLDNEVDHQESDAEQSESDEEATELAHGTKRKRSASEESVDPLGTVDGPLRKRAVSVKAGIDSESVSEDDSTAEDQGRMASSRESTVEPAVSSERDDEQDAEEEQLDGEDVPTKNGLEKRSDSRSAKVVHSAVGDDEDIEEPEEPEETEDVEEGDAPDEVEAEEEDEHAGEDVDEAEAERKNEEEFAKKMVAMDSLVELEKQFAILRDKLYNERIGDINKQLLQLNGPQPTNSEYLEKLQYVIRHRDEKQDYEHKLLAFKIQSLKTKSVAERSQIHTAYYQTVRDIREKYLDLANDQFYKIQRDRFKPDESMPSYSIPFPERRSQQITQQASYNREVSVLAGVAKYVGFPAAPEITPARQHEIEEDLEKMGLPSLPVRMHAASNGTTYVGPFTSAAEEQFLEQTPWANPQHPVHSRLNKNLAGQQNPDSIYATPANQKTTMDSNTTHGSASTIPENLSAQASSALNTPHDQEHYHGSADRPSVVGHRVASNGLPPRTSLSPTDTRKVGSVTQYRLDKRIIEDGPGPAVHSPPQSRNMFNSPHGVTHAPSAHDSLNQHQNSSPLASVHSGITAGAGYNRFGAR